LIVRKHLLRIAVLVVILASAIALAVPDKAPSVRSEALPCCQHDGILYCFDFTAGQNLTCQVLDAKTVLCTGA
jgi:hypothetical protein